MLIRRNMKFKLKQHIFDESIRKMKCKARNSDNDINAWIFFYSMKLQRFYPFSLRLIEWFKLESHCRDCSSTESKLAKQNNQQLSCNLDDAFLCTMIESSISPYTILIERPARMVSHELEPVVQSVFLHNEFWHAKLTIHNTTPLNSSHFVGIISTHMRWTMCARVRPTWKGLNLCTYFTIFT